LFLARLFGQPVPGKKHCNFLRAWCHFAVRQNGEQKITVSEDRLAGAVERLFEGTG